MSRTTLAVCPDKRKFTFGERANTVLDRSSAKDDIVEDPLDPTAEFPEGQDSMFPTIAKKASRYLERLDGRLNIDLFFKMNVGVIARSIGKSLNQVVSLIGKVSVPQPITGRLLVSGFTIDNAHNILAIVLRGSAI